MPPWQRHVSSDIPANHSPFFAPAMDPTLGIATRAQAIAALAYLAPTGDRPA